MQYFYEGHMIGNPHFPPEPENGLMDSTYREIHLEDGRTPNMLFSGDLPYNTNNNPYTYYIEADTSDYDPMAVEWSQKPENSWFGSDNIMTVAALTIDAQLKEEGYNPASPDFYQEVDSRMRQEFPHKFNQQVIEQEVPTQRATQQVVAGQSRSPTNSSSKKVKLTQEDVRMAQKWNIPLEKYAAEKGITKHDHNKV